MLEWKNQGSVKAERQGHSNILRITIKGGKKRVNIIKAQILKHHRQGKEGTHAIIYGTISNVQTVICYPRGCIIILTKLLNGLC